MFKRLIEWMINVFEPAPPVEKPAKRPYVRKARSLPSRATITKEKLSRKTTMPLKKSASPKAFKENIKTEIKAGKPVKQAVAIAYAEKNAATKSKKTKPKRV
jgi:hypothetical protein